MARNPGTGVYTLPAVYLAVPGQPILAGSSNTTLEDVQTTFNAAWPVSIGGTGGTSAITSWDAINTRGTAVPTAASVDLNLVTGPNLHFTGVVSVATVGLASGAMRFIVADSAFQLTASATLIVNGSTTVNAAVPAGAMITFIGDPSSVVRAYVGTVTGGVGYFSAIHFTSTAGTLDWGGTANIGNVAGSPFITDNGGKTFIFTDGHLTGSGITIGAAGYTSPNSLYLSDSVAGTYITAVSADAGAASGPDFELYRNSASPAASDVLGRFFRYGRDSAANKQEYASDKVTIIDATSTSEDAIWEDFVTVGGTSTAFLRRGALASGTADPNNVGLPLGQLSFPATQNPSSNANTLDDYEEGTFTPAFVSSGATFNYGASRSGEYIKAGQMVYYSLIIQLATTGNTLTANQLTISGLPYSADTLFLQMAAPVQWVASTTSYMNVSAGVNASATTLNLYGQTAAGVNGNGAVNSNALLHATNGSILIVTGCYRAAA